MKMLLRVMSSELLVVLVMMILSSRRGLFNSECRLGVAINARDTTGPMNDKPKKDKKILKELTLFSSPPPFGNNYPTTHIRQ